MSIQEALKLLRLELGMTQHDLAKSINKAYITVNRWENGKAFPSRENSKNIIEVAKQENASDNCIAYLEEVLLPKLKRSRSVAQFGFPDIDRDFMFQLADDSANAIYVIEEKTYKLLYINKKAYEMADYYKSIKNNKIDLNEKNDNNIRNYECFSYFTGDKKPCEFCPLKNIVHDYYNDTYLFLPIVGKTVKLHAKKTVVNGKNAYVFNVTDITEEDGAKTALYELTNEIPAGVGIYNVYKNGLITLEFMNDKLFNLIGEERKKAIKNQKDSDVCLIHKDDKKLLTAAIKKAKKENINVGVTLRMKTSDNKFSLININGRIIGRKEDKDTYYCLFTLVN